MWKHGEPEFKSEGTLMPVVFEECPLLGHHMGFGIYFEQK